MNRLAHCLTALAMIMAPMAAGAQGLDPDGWRHSLPEQPDHVLIENAMLWTATGEGLIEEADMLIRRGRIERIGRDLSAPRGAEVIDAAGRHVTPGLIDAHSHAAISGGVNESSLISTAMVRIRDVINAESGNIPRQIAGGLTTMHLMHGSANAIGGQNATVKLRWGADPEDMLIDGARETIKFALGENPKQSNWQPDTPRYPQTRQGVNQIVDERFQDVRAYIEAHGERPGRDRVPPRRNLEMEALAEILAGDRDVHSHGYRADEFLALMNTAEEHGFRIRAFHHVLEGYKVADEMAAHGAGASTFSDWWAFKYEARDAIPYNAAIMDERDVLVSLNSDNPELARRMNLEAAKAVRYGGVDRHRALMMVTANPAEQLGIDGRTGSLREGLDADVVIWSGDPLSAYSRVDQTWIDGRLYFDRRADMEKREALEAERQELIEMVRASENGEDEDEADPESGEESEQSPDEDDPGLARLRKLFGGA